MVDHHSATAPGEPVNTFRQEVRAGSGRTVWHWLIRCLVTVFLLAILFRRVPWQEVWPVWQGLPLRVWFLAVALAVLSMLISAYKWQLILAEPGETTPGTGRLLRIYLIGLFFNNFLPSGMGGDVVRVALAAKTTGTPRAAASVLLERLLAAVGLVLPSLLIYFPFRAQLGAVSVAVPLLAMGVILLAAVLLFPGWAGVVVRLCGRWPQVALGLGRSFETLARYRRRPGMLLRVILWSTVFQGTVILINYALFMGMEVPVSLAACAVLVPLISALAMLPLSINGLGLREWSYVTLFASLGVDTAASLAVSLTFFLVVLLVSLAGGVLYVLEK